MNEIILRALARFHADRRGVTMLEYGLLATLIAVAVIAGARLLGTNIGAAFNTIAGRIANP